MYEGDEHLDIIDKIHSEIALLFVKDFIKKYKFETYKDEVDFPFIVLVKFAVGYEDPKSDELVLIWSEVLKHISKLSPYGDLLSQTTKNFIESVADKSSLNYNKLEYRVKVRVCIALINMVYDTENFRDYLQEAMDNTSGLMKEKNEILAEMKHEEQEKIDLKVKIELAEKAQKEEEEKMAFMSRTELNKRNKELESERKEMNKVEYLFMNTILYLSKRFF